MPEEVVAGAAAVGGEGGAGGGGSEGGGIAVEEPPPGAAPGEGGGELAPGGEGGEPAPGEGEGGGEGDPDAALSQDARIVDVKTRQQLADLRKANPALAKVAGDAIFARQAIMKEFPDAKSMGDVIKTVRAVNQTLAAVGGEEGITKMQGDVEAYEKEIGQFSNGDPELVQQLHEGNPDGFVKNIANGLDLLAEKEGEIGGRFDQALTPAFNAKIQKAGLPTAIDNLLGLIEKGEQDAAKALATNVRKWLSDVDGYAKQLSESKTTKDPKAEALTAREQNIQKAEVAQYEGKISGDVNNLNNDAMRPLLEGLFKTLKLDGDGRKEFTNLLQSKVWAAMKADKVFQRNARNIMAKKDPAASAKFINSKFTELLSGPDGMFIRLRNQMYPHFATAKPAPKAGAPAPKAGSPAATVIKVAANARPKHDEVDWNKTDDMDWIRGKAILKNGKEHRFDPNSPPNKI